MLPEPAQALTDPTETLRLHGFTESGSEAPLRDLVTLAATFCESAAALVLQDSGGCWFLTGSGLSEAHLLRLQPALAAGGGPEAEPPAWPDPDLQLVTGLWLEDGGRQPLGRLCLLGPAARTLSAAQEAGLARIAGQITALVQAKAEHAERRALQRGPSGTSFVPGLVHELRNFIFGISASLDAFQARFSGQEGPSRYATVMRGSVDRLNAFLEELREYGDPKLLSWSERALEPILREAVEHHRGLASSSEVRIDLELSSPLPTLLADDESLRTAFIRLIDLALQQESAGGQVAIRVGTRLQAGRPVIYGHLDGAGLKLQDIDLARLFEPFYYRASGLGRLALPVARRIFEAHGGNLAAAPSPDGGMRLGFMLPAL